MGDAKLQMTQKEKVVSPQNQQGKERVKSLTERLRWGKRLTLTTGVRGGRGNRRFGGKDDAIGFYIDATKKR